MEGELTPKLQEHYDFTTTAQEKAEPEFKFFEPRPLKAVYSIRTDWRMVE